MHQKVLIVDDEHGVRESIRLLLKGRYSLELAVNGHDAIAKIEIFRPDIVLLDLKMPDMSGIDVLQRIKQIDPTVEVVLVTAYATVETARKALLLGAFDYITKPFNPQELEGIVRRGVKQRFDSIQQSATLQAFKKDYQSLREEIDQAKLQMATHVRDTIYALLMSLELRDAYSGQHSMAVLWLADQFARHLGVSADERYCLRRAALVHDLGKVGVPEEILNKPDRLTSEERVIMENHSVLSAEIIGNVEALSDLAPIVRAHHERWDGSGYPDKTSGDDIPWLAQILTLCDTVHAMSSDRCYRARLPEHEIWRELLAQRGRQFKGELVDAILGSGLIPRIHQAEDSGQMVLTTQQIRQVLDSPSASPELVIP